MENRRKRKIELLAPAGSYETFCAVIAAGADAVYVGGTAFGARAYANNFSEEELLKAIDYAHVHNRKLYLTVNTLFKEKELTEQLYSYLLPYYKQGLDAVIVQDIGAMKFIREHFPDLEIHTSTQMTVTNRYGAQMMKELGANRIVTAREMSFVEIEDIAKHVDVEIESFVHGALCYCFSGQCLFSSMIGGRSGNRGRCAQPCRLPYAVVDEKNKVMNNPKKPYILSLKDLCTVKLIPQLVKAGVYSFKIDGRMKQTEYAAGVVEIYRKYIDLYLEKGENGFTVKKEDEQRLLELGNRCGFTEGYYKKHNGADMITFEQPSHKKGEIHTVIPDEIKEKIKGTLILSQDLPAKMTVAYDDITVTVEGDTVQAAQNQPLSYEKVKENIQKTGNTPFEFEILDIMMDDAIFMPMKALNQLRRDALLKLENFLLTKYRRVEAALPNQPDGLKKSQVKEERPLITASIEMRNQLLPLLECQAVSEVYLDSSCYTRDTLLNDLYEDCNLTKEKGKKVYFIMPSVFRKHTSDFYEKIMDKLVKIGIDGFVVKSYDVLRFLKSRVPDANIVIDHNLYSYNSKAIEALNSYSPIRITAPYELNRKELLHRNNHNSELIIYGRISLMTSAQCTKKSTIGCQKKSGVSYLKDRYDKQFAVKNNCEECYNVIYNSLPLALFKVADEIKEMGFAAYRLAFTVENEQKVREILQLLEHPKEAFVEDFTYGHYKRGVE